MAGEESGVATPIKSAVEIATRMRKENVADIAKAANEITDPETRRLFVAMSFVDRESRGNAALVIAVLVIVWQVLELIEKVNV